jgi:hypothetical protein
MLAQIFNRRKKKTESFAQLNDALEAIGSRLRVEGRVVSKGNRLCHIFGSFIDFWENGLKWYGVDGVTVEDQAELLHGWVELCLNSDTLEEMVPGLEFPIARKKIEMGEKTFLGWYWENLKNRRDNRFGELIELFASHQMTRKLMTYFEARDFGFSSNIGQVNGLDYQDLPRIRITDDWKYEVHLPNMSMVNSSENAGRGAGGVGQRGTAKEAFELALKLLPHNVGHAQYFRCNGCPPSPNVA